MNTFPGYMRATVFAEKRAVFPAYVQPKHNGIRCLTDGRVAWTREGNLHAEHIQKRIRKRDWVSPFDGWWYDGELVLPKEQFSFQKTQSAVAAENEHSHLLDLKIFDAFNLTKWPDASFGDRNDNVPCFGCETHKVERIEEVEMWYNDFLARGYEGLIFRQDTPYKLGSAGRRLMKYKPKDSAEFFCVDVWEGRGKNVGVPTFRLLRPDVIYQLGMVATKKNTFGAVPKGEYTEKKALWQKYRDGSCLGKMYTVEFADLYESGVPQFPVGLGFREVDGPGHE